MQDDQLKPGVAYTPKPAEPHVEQQNAPVAPQQPAGEPLTPQVPQAQEQNQDTPDEAQDAPDAETTLLSWNAPEFTFTNKPKGWYGLLILFFGGMIGLAIYTQQYIAIGLFVLMAIALIMYARRQPRTLNYTITTHGIYVGDKRYAFDSFSSFYEVSDYGQKTLELVPAKQFGTLVSLPVVDNDQENSAEELLGSVLPKVPARNDMIDRLLRTLRF